MSVRVNTLCWSMPQGYYFGLQIAVFGTNGWGAMPSNTFYVANEYCWCHWVHATVRCVFGQHLDGGREATRTPCTHSLGVCTTTGGSGGVSPERTCTVGHLGDEKRLLQTQMACPNAWDMPFGSKTDVQHALCEHAGHICVSRAVSKGLVRPF